MKESSDVWFIAFLMFQGIKIKETKMAADKKVVCRFEMSEDEWAQKKLEFNNNEVVQKYKSLIRQIKQMSD